MSEGPIDAAGPANAFDLVFLPIIYDRYRPAPFLIQIPD